MHVARWRGERWTYPARTVWDPMSRTIAEISSPPYMVIEGREGEREGGGWGGAAVLNGRAGDWRGWCGPEAVVSGAASTRREAGTVDEAGGRRRNTRGASTVALSTASSSASEYQSVPLCTV